MAPVPPPIPPAPAAAQYGPARFPALRTIGALILREMSTRYGRTPGGYIWAILEPLGAILALSIAFSLVLRTPPLGTSFILFYASGYMPFSFYQSISNMVARSISFSKPLLQYPTVSWIDAVLGRLLLNALTGILVAILLFSSIIFLLHDHTRISMLPAITAFGLAALMALGVGLVNCAVMGLIPLWERAWAILTRPLFLASGVFFIYEAMPTGAQNVLWYNPLLHITGMMRTAIYPTYTPTYISPVYVLVIALTLITLGLILMGRYHRDILNR